MKRAASSFAADEGKKPLIEKSSDTDATSRKSSKRKKSAESRGSFGKKSEKGRRKNTGSIASVGSAEDVEVDTFKKLVYIFVARDSDMFVFEINLEPKIQSAKYSAEIYEALNYF